MVKTYLLLTKPGIIIGNSIVAMGGFLLASKGNVDGGLLVATLIGIALVIASACVSNNYIDHDIDEKMSRTKNRALARGTISGKGALAYATILGLAGFLILAVCTNLLTVLLGVLAFFVYVVLYGIWKRRSVHGTLVGSIAGAIPPVAGYTAANNHLGIEAGLLFFILVFWQMPHFYAIAMYRFDDYKAASIPVLPIKKGMRRAKVEILLYIAGFTGMVALLTLLGYTGYVYLAFAVLLGLLWFFMGAKSFKTTDDRGWAHKMFRFSLIVILLLPVLWALDVFLP